LSSWSSDDALFWFAVAFVSACAVGMVIVAILHVFMKPPNESDIMNEIRRERGKVIEKKGEKQE
jgi:hypothetical protein